MKLDFCVVCGSKEDLHQHHIIPVVLSDDKREVTTDNTITVCGYHHKLIHGIQQKDHFNHSVLTKKGLIKARNDGKTLGRKSKTTEKEKEEIIDMLIKGISVSSVARKYNISRATVISIRETFKIKKKYSFNWNDNNWERGI